MSGFVGIINLDGAPIDRNLLRELTRSISYRGPDAQEIWCQGHVGFGHTMLRTTREAARERQPCSLDDETWIAADCRVDAREELSSKLRVRDKGNVKEATDPELILHAYLRWGEGCVQHLIGDFTFAIWDGRNRRLFCARDHMGIKLFHYARVGNCLIFGNTLNSLRLHPAVSSRLNDQAIGDYLLFGLNQDQSTSSFKDIRRLPPAHTLTCTDLELKTSRYWTLPIDPPLRLKRADDYVERFLCLARTVVKDRLRTENVGVLMSGGLDSPGLAAFAKEAGANVAAYTVVYDQLMADNERFYAGMAAAHLNIPIHFQVADDYDLYEAVGQGACRSPDPVYVPVFGPEPRFRELGAIARRSKVALFGEGPDNALHYEWRSYVSHELKRLQFWYLIKEVASFPFLFREVPLQKRIKSPLRARTPSAPTSIPPWLNRDFAARAGLFERWRESRLRPESEHPVRPRAYESFSLRLWQLVFEAFDPGVTCLPVEIRHPYIDIRMMRYLLALPILPWCRDKYIMRRALRVYLPDEVLVRPKSPLSSNPEFEKWKQVDLKLELSQAVAEYVDISWHGVKIDSPDSLWINLRPITLGIFLQTAVQNCTLTKGCTQEDVYEKQSTARTS
jgi:asparagine synthase (glutamine-hydrolysing)